MTNHLHVLLCLYRKSDMRLRDVAFHVGITERMVQRIIVELVAEKGYLHVVKEGRRNRYLIDSGLRLRHPLEIQHTICLRLARVLELATRLFYRLGRTRRGGEKDPASHRFLRPHCRCSPLPKMYTPVRSDSSVLTPIFCGVPVFPPPTALSRRYYMTISTRNKFPVFEILVTGARRCFAKTQKKIGGIIDRKWQEVWVGSPRAKKD